MRYQPLSQFTNCQHVRAARVIAGLRQKELAAVAGIQGNSVRRVEKFQQAGYRDNAALFIPSTGEIAVPGHPWAA